MKHILSIPLTILTLLGVVLSSSAYAQKQLRYENHIYEDDIQTVLLYQSNTNYPVPVLKMGTNDALTLMFDELTNNNDYYQITLVHCNAYWYPSDLQPLQYLDGSDYEDITNFKFASNTYQRYVHYEISFPNSNIRPKLSGNYLLKVYRNFDKEDVIITRRIFVLDAKVNFEIDIKPATIADARFSRQEVDFTARVKDYQIMNPHQDVTVILSQNNRWDNAITGLKPLFIVGNEYRYNYERENLFDGTNEFRFVDFRSFRAFSQNVKDRYIDGVYNLILKPEEKRGYQRYVEFIDFNGKRVVANNDLKTNGALDGDYAWVYFQLQAQTPLRTGELYLIGEMSDWKPLPRFKMNYNAAAQSYEAKVLLKQGYYSYLYMTVDDEGMAYNTSETEGNYMETENDYYIYFYCRNQSFDYDELIGFTHSSSKIR